MYQDRWNRKYRKNPVFRDFRGLTRIYTVFYESIGLKLLACVELTLKLCDVIFSTSGRQTKPEVNTFAMKTSIFRQ